MTSPAAGAPSGDAQQGDGTTSGGEAQAQQGPDVGALTEQLNQLGQGMEGMREFLQSQPWQQPADEGAGGEPEQPQIDPNALTEYTYGDEEAAKNLASVIESQMAQREAALRQEFQRELGTVAERVTERERLEQMGDLVAEFPDMAKPEVAQQIVQQTHELAAANGWGDEWANSPSSWRLVYAAQEMHRIAQEEGREGQAPAHLEGGGGAAQAQKANPGDDFLKMLDDGAGTGRSVLPFP
jgi:hypothetical protein